MPRNSSGTYSLPAGNPVAPNTLIETSWANPTMSDLGAAMTDSLDRNGRGSMLAPLKLTDGTVAAPAFAFTSETTTGMYRAASNTLAFAVAGVLAMSMNATTIAFNKTVAFTNAVAFPQGTVGAPGVAFSLDLDTGMWSPAADVIAWSTAAAERLRLSAAGLVSTVIQSNPLGAAATPSYSFTGDLNTGMWSPGADLLALSTAGAERMRIDSSGNVLPGANGTQTLGGSALRWSTVYAQALSDGSDQLIGSSGTTVRVGYGASWTALAFATGATERARIDSSGNVGIGGAPTGRLDVMAAGQIIARIRATDASNVRLQLQNSVSGATSQDGLLLQMAGDGVSGYLWNYENGPVIIGTNDAERMRIDASGNVGVGKTPSYKLDVNGFASAHNWVIGTESTTSAGTFGFTNGNGPAIQVFGSGTGPAGSLLFLTGNNAERMRIDSSGRVGIGRTPTAQKLEVQGTAATVNGDFLWSTSGGGDARFGYEAYTATGCFNLWSASNVGISFGTGLTERMRITGTGVIQDGSGLELGYRKLNRVIYGSGASTLQQSDNGKCHYKSDNTNVTVPTGLTDGTFITIFNATGSARTIVQGAGLTLLRAGTVSAGSVTLAVNGYARVWILAGGTTAVVDGNIS